MKKSFVVNGVLAGILALGVFASCKAETEDGEEKSVVETNELSGKTFAADFDGDLYSFDFKNDTYTLTSKEKSSLKYCGEFYIRYGYTNSYTVNSEIGYFLSKELSETVSYERDGITLYTEPNTIPETLEEYKAEKIKLYKALNPDITEEQIAELLNDDYACKSAENFNEWREARILIEKGEKKFYYTWAYKLEDNKLVLFDEDWSFIPQGLKFGDIFNASYEYFYSSEIPTEFEHPDFQIDVDIGTMAKEKSTIIIWENNADTQYTIFSATNDSMTIAKVTGHKDGYIEFDESNAFTTPITYTNGENKVTATITIEGKEYSFDIEYVTKEEINKVLEEDSVEYTLQ